LLPQEEEKQEWHWPKLPARLPKSSIS